MSESRRGYSLLEVLVVLAIIVVLAAMAAPAIDSMYADQKLTDASDEVRAKWALARSRSIDEGVPYQFGVVWGDSNWRIAPEDEQFWTGNGASVPGEFDEDPLIEAGNLPHNIRFVSGESAVSTGPVTAPDEQAASPAPAEVDASRYFPLVTFYPDGSVVCNLPDGSSPDILEVFLQGRSSSRLVLTLRSMTGVTSTRWDVR